MGAARPESPVIRVAAGIVVDDAGRWLLVRKQGTSRFMQPGGKPEPGESGAETLARELAEEVGVVVCADELVPRGTWHGDAANEPGHALVADVFEVPGRHSPVAAAEIAELVWVDPGEPGVPLAPLTVALLALHARP
ncbi:NUDIX hydrolase [Luteimicrobium subarcticum]|uniref:ADP-ribose pyrophosphatase YjhB (NUDIX family) n=1 Tax=Luteimicrobium subarcticum TaxID=620910 RepID=A0A2M8WWE7_9MICO|nr:NUDIX domain-containing protein [Luteimicrobium subarcticum]PJI95248.1 ADP-ribose pyrophosphatase YjhB (NUDIX family) [Luteimicrobium subarcticum]